MLHVTRYLTTGGACDADEVTVCTHGETGCQQIVACNETEEHCWDCEGATTIPYDKHKVSENVSIYTIWLRWIHKTT